MTSFVTRMMITSMSLAGIVSATAPVALGQSDPSTSAILKVSPPSISLRIGFRSKTPASKSLTISTTGNNEVTWSIESDSPRWLSVDPPRGHLSGEGSAEIAVRIDSAALQAGQYDAKLSVTWTARQIVQTMVPQWGPTQSTVVPVALVVRALPPRPSPTMSPTPERLKPESQVPWTVVIVIVAVIEGALLAGRALLRSTSSPPPTAELEVRLSVPSTIPTIRSREPLLSQFLRVHLTGGPGEIHITPATGLVRAIDENQERER